MAGRTRELISRRTYNFNNGSAVITAVKLWDVTDATSGSLHVRVHSSDVASSSTIEVKAVQTGPTDEDPSTDFDGDTIATCSIDATVSGNAPILVSDGFTADFGPWLEIQVDGTQSGGNCTAEISVYGCAKD